MDATIDLARACGLIGRRSELAAIDSTGMNSGCASRYFGQRSGREYHRFPKVSVVTDVRSHLFLGVVIDRGPKPDDIEFHRVARQAHRRHPFDALLGDVGFDGEHHQAFLWNELGVLGIIPPTRGRPPDSPGHLPPTFFRHFIATHWPKEIYGQRWQVECDFSMLKRLLDADLRARLRHCIDREIFLRILALNLMILLLLNAQEQCFEQSKNVPFFRMSPFFGRNFCWGRNECI